MSARPFICRLVLLLLVLGHSSGAIVSQKWLSSSVSSATLESSIAQETYKTSSKQLCLSLAMHAIEDDWVALACYEAGECTLYNQDVADLGVTDTSLGNTVCMAMEQEVQAGTNCTDESVTYQLGEKQTDSDCPRSFDNICTPNGLVPVASDSDAYPSAPECLDPYSSTAAGCLFFQKWPGKTWCDAREFCRTISGDLVSPDTVALLDSLRTVKSAFDGGDFHVGLISDTNGTFRWLSNGRVPTQAEWRNGEPNYGNQIGCTRFAYGAELDDDHCNRNEGYICEIKIVP